MSVSESMEKEIELPLHHPELSSPMKNIGKVDPKDESKIMKFLKKINPFKFDSPHLDEFNRRVQTMNTVADIKISDV